MTLISHSHRFIFLSTQKTASTSVETALAPLCLPPGADPETRGMVVSEAGVLGARRPGARDPWVKHMSAAKVRRQVGADVWRNYFKFATVRNPYARAVSMFFYRLPPARRQALTDAPFATARAAFQAWLPQSDLRKNLGKLTIGPRYALDHVLFQERLDADFAALARHIGAPGVALPRRNAGRHGRREHWREYYDAPSRAIVARACAFELAFFGYGFEGGPEIRPAAARLAALLRGDPARAPAALSPPVLPTP